MVRLSNAHLILLGSGAIFLWLIVGSNDILPDVNPAPPQVEMIQADLGTHAARMQAHGEIKSRKQATLEAKITADVDQVLVKEGEYVKKNQSVIKLKSRKVQLTLEEAIYRLQQLHHAIDTERTQQAFDREALQNHKELQLLQQKEVNRYQYLYQHQQLSRTRLETAQQAYLKESLATLELERSVSNHENRLASLFQDYQAQETLTQKAKIDYERLTIKAPYSGYITKIMVNPGDRMQLHETMLRMYAPDSLEIHVQLPPEDYVKIDQKTEGHVITQKGLTPIRLVTLEKHINPQTGSYNAIFQPLLLDAITLGKWVSVIIHLPPQPQTILVPKTSLYFNDTIYLIDEKDELQPIAVEILGESKELPSSVVVESPALKATQKVLVTHIPNAQTGMRVTPWDQAS